MAPNTPTHFGIINPLPTFDVRDISTPLKNLSCVQHQYSASDEAAEVTPLPLSLDVTHLQPDSQDKIYISYEEVHNAVDKTLRPFVNHYKPDVVIAINGGGNFLSMLLGSTAPTLSVVVSTGPNFITNENNVLRIQQWFDETSTEGLRVNHSRVLLVTDSEMTPGMLNFVKSELCARSMPSQVAAVLLHQQQSASVCDAIEIASAMDAPSHAQVYYPWNSDLSYSQHGTTIALEEQHTKEEEQLEEEYWEWHAKDPLNVTQIEKQLISDSRRRQKETSTKIAHSNGEVENYWDWEVKEPNASDILAKIMAYEKIRPTFCIEHIEENLLKSAEEQEDTYEHRSTKNIFLGDNSDFWTWTSQSTDDDINTSEKLLTNIVQEDRISQLLSVDHTEQQLKQHSSEEESKTSDESPYWSWMSSNIYAETRLEEYLEHVNKDDLNAPHEEEKTEQVHMVDVNLEKEVLAIKSAMNPTELLEWVLDSCQLGLTPSAEIVRKLLSSNIQKEDIYQPLKQLSSTQIKENVKANESYCDDKPSAKETESYWDDTPTADVPEEHSYWDERPSTVATITEEHSYWDERPSLAAAVSDESNSYWEVNPESSDEYAPSSLDEAPITDSQPQTTLIHADDNDRSSIAAYYTELRNNKNAIAISPIINNEDDERSALAAYYSQQMSQQAHVNVTPVAQQPAVVEESINCKQQDVKEGNVSYWDEGCDNHELYEDDESMQEEDVESYWD